MARTYLVVPRMERGEGCQMVFHLGFGQVLEQWLKLLLVGRLLWEDALLVRTLVERTELGMVGDVEEFLAILSVTEWLACHPRTLDPL